jgi:uncharacterized protein (TIGR03435 family)
MRCLNKAGFILVIATTLVLPVSAQDSGPKFEVASVKPSNSGRPGISIETEPGRFKAINATVSFLIQYAYGLKDFQLSGGPGWVGSDKFDIDAKSEAKAQDLGDREFPPMMRTLLADRFQLKFHRETRTMPVFDLVVTKGWAEIRTLDRDGKEQYQAQQRPNSDFERNCCRASFDSVEHSRQESTGQDRAHRGVRYDVEMDAG